MQIIFNVIKFSLQLKKTKHFNSTVWVPCSFSLTHTHTHTQAACDHTCATEECEDSTELVVVRVSGSAHNPFLCAGGRGDTETCSLRCYRFAQLWACHIVSKTKRPQKVPQTQPQALTQTQGDGKRKTQRGFINENTAKHKEIHWKPLNYCSFVLYWIWKKYTNKMHGHVSV